ncbi:MAG: SDR family NAD(P)-dependent oxidoreductase, partial [Acidimicrobiales bacterium]
MTHGGSPAFAGRRVLVTGGSSGIGRATVSAFAAAGAAVIAAGRDEARLAAVREEAPPGAVHTVRADLRDRDQLAALVETAWEGGAVDVLVNNAGVGAAQPFLEIAASSWDEVLEVDLTAPFLLAQAAARRMVDAGGGVIVNVA